MATIVDNPAELNAAILAADNAAAGSGEIDIVVGDDMVLTSALTPIALASGVTLVIQGDDHTLTSDDQSASPSFVSGAVAIENLNVDVSGWLGTWLNVTGGATVQVTNSAFQNGVGVLSGTLELTDPSGDIGGNISFTNEPGPAATLKIDAGVTLSNQIVGFSDNDLIDFVGVNNLSSQLVAASGFAPSVQIGDQSIQFYYTGGVLAVSRDGAGGVLVIQATANYANISTAAQLSAAIAAIDLQSLASTGAANAYSISLAAGVTIAETLDLSAINLRAGDTLALHGDGATLDGGDTYEGLFDYAGQLTVDNLTIANAKAQGGAAGGLYAGGGAGLGGGLFVGSNVAGDAGAVTLANVGFVNDSAIGGNVEGATYFDGGGGGLNGGNGGAALSGGGGGIGIGADGGGVGADQIAGAGIVVGAESGGVNLDGGGGSNSGKPGGVGGLDSYGGGSGGFMQNSVGPGFGGGGYQSGGGGFGGGGGRHPNSGGGGFGAGSGDRSDPLANGGGGLGAGGDIFVQAGASLTIAGGALGVGTVAGGVSPDQSGQGYGSGLFLQGDETITLGAGAAAGVVTTISGVIADQNGAWASNHAGALPQAGVDPVDGSSYQGVGSLIVSGAGTVDLAAANQYTGGTTVESGVLELGDDSAAGSGAIFLDAGATLAFSADDLTIANPIVFSGAGSSPVVSTIDVGTFTVKTLSGIVADGAGASGQLDKTGYGTLVLTGANTYSGGTLLEQGALELGSDSAAGAGAISFSQDARLKFDAGVTPTNAILNFGHGDAIDFAGLNDATATLSSAGVLTVANGATSETINNFGLDDYVGNGGVYLRASSDGSGGTDILLSPAPLGYYVPPGSTQLIEAPAGYYVLVSRNSADMADPAGTYSGPGADSFTRDQPGYYSGPAAPAEILAAAPVISGTLAGQLLADGQSLSPFANVAIADPNAGYDATSLSVTIAGGGTLSGAGVTQTGAGQYSIDTSAGLNVDLNAAIYTPATSASSQNVTFTLSATSTVLGAYTSNGAPIVETSVDTTTSVVVDPGPSVVVNPTLPTGAPNDAVVIATVTPGIAGESLTLVQTAGAGAVTLGAENPDGSYDVSYVQGDITNATSDSVAYTVADVQSGAVSAPVSTTLVVATLPTISGTLASLTTTSEAPLSPFAAAVVGDENAGVDDTLTILMTGAGGALTGAGLTPAGGGAYTLTGSAETLTSALQALVFTPTAGGQGTVSATQFSLTDESDIPGHHHRPATATATTTVTDIDPSLVLGGFAQNAITDAQTLNPFATMTISDTVAGDQDSATISFAAANGALSGAGLSTATLNGGVASYTLAATDAASLQGELQALTFTPTAHQVPGGSQVTTAFTVNVTGTLAATPTQSLTNGVNRPYAVTTDAAGDVFVANSDVNTVQEFSASGVLLRTMSDGVQQPHALVTDAAGDVFVANYGANDVEEFSASGTLTQTLSDGLNGPLSLAIDAAGDVFVANDLSDSVVEFSASGAQIRTLTQDLGHAQALATDAAGDVYVANNFLDDDVKEFSVSGVLLRDLTNGIENPQALATDAAGDLFVANVNNNTVEKFSASGVLLQTMSSGGNYPVSLATDSSGDIYVANKLSSTVEEFSASGALLRTLSNGVNLPTSVTTDAAGDVFVANFGAKSVVEFGPIVTAQDSTTTVTVTAVAAPKINGSVGAQTTVGDGQILPFAGLGLIDRNAGASDTLTISLSGPALGALTLIVAGTGATLSGSGASYTLTGSAQQVSSALPNLAYNPLKGQPNTSATTNFTLVDVSSASPLLSNSSTTSVTNYDFAVPPTISGAMGGLVVGVHGTIRPFATVTVGDLNANATDSLMVTISGGGSLSGAGVAFTGGGYTISAASLAALNADIRAAVYTPAASASAQSVSFKLTETAAASGGATILSTTNSATTLTVDPGPTATNLAAKVNLGGTVDLTQQIVAAAKPGLQGDALTIVADNASGAAGQVSLVNGRLVYAATGAGLSHIAANGSQSVTFGFTISDAYGDTSSATGSVQVSNPAAVINGGPFGLQTIQGTAGADVINAYGLFDTIFDNGGNDLVNAGHGNATVHAGSGDVVVNLNGYFDAVSGGGGWDKVSGSQGSATVSLGDGDDNVSTGGYFNSIALGNGKDTVNAGLGAAWVLLGNGADTVVAGGYGDTIRAGNGADTIGGGAGSETILLGNGDDVVNAGGYSNAITVGAGKNTIVAGSGLDQVTAGAGVDAITLAGYSNTVTLNGTTATVSSCMGNETLIANGGQDTLGFAGYGDIAKFSGPVSASVSDKASGLWLEVGSNTTTLAVSGFGSKDATGVIDLLNGAGGYRSAAAAFAALRSDGHGGTSLSLGSGGSIDFVGTTATQLHALNFAVGRS